MAWRRAASAAVGALLSATTDPPPSGDLHLVLAFLAQLERADGDAVVAWRRQALHARWGGRYQRLAARRIRRLLPGLLPAADQEGGEGGEVWFEAPRSARDPSFTLRSCLPRRVPADSRRGRLLAHLGAETAERLRSVSRSALRDLLALLHRLLPAGVQGVRELRQWGPEDWLDAYEAAYTPGAPRLGFSHLRTHLRLLAVVHADVLHTQPPPARIPVPIRGGRLPPAASSGTGAAAPWGGFGTSGSSAVDEAERRRRHALRTRVAELRLRLCRPSSSGPGAAAPHGGGGGALSCEEAHRVLEAAHSDLERLVVLLFLTTGLRIGGVARLRRPPSTGRHTTAAEVPAELETTEKNGVVRRVQLSHVCRVFVSRWLRHGDHRGSAYLFPSARQPARAVGTRRLWGVCRVVFERAGVPGGHPHAFRHTVVQLLYLAGGLSFETIAKWIGHRSVTVTSGVYGQLRQADLQSRLLGVPFLAEDAGGQAARRAAWRRLAETIRSPPYETAPEEWRGLPQAAPAAAPPEEDAAADDPHRRRARLAAATACAMRVLGRQTVHEGAVAGVPQRLPGVDPQPVHLHDVVHEHPPEQ